MAFEIGVGTFSFFCETFAKLGFPTVAVEPMPTPTLIKLCNKRNIRLITGVVSDIDGFATLYIGNYEGAENTNLNSLYSNWWGSSAKTKEVVSVTLPRLLSNVGASKITCMKLDVEGAELSIISQFSSLSETEIPSVVMFEYGGGGQRNDGEGGWSSAYLGATMDCLKIMKSCGFDETIVIDATSSRGHIVNLQNSTMMVDEFFEPQAVYGNIIAFRQYRPDAQELAKICQLYVGDEPSPSPLQQIFGFVRRQLG